MTDKRAACCVLALGLLSLAGCEPRQGMESAAVQPAAGEAVVAHPERLPAPTWAEAANAVYAGPMGMQFMLENGEWQGEPYAEGSVVSPRAGLVRDFLLSGDLDGDGADESAVLVWTSTGGSGTFDYLAVVERTADGTVAERASAALGDRVQVRDAQLAGRRVVLDVVQAGPDDARCCPGQKMRRIFVLEEDAMIEIPSEDRGRLSVADLDGDWKLLELGRGRPVPGDVQIGARFAGGRLSGKAACNRYTGRVEAGDAPGDLALAGPLAVTRMMCPPPLMEWERDYLQALEGLRKFSFTAGKLVLTWSTDDGVDSLRFEPVQSPDAPAAGE